MPRAAESRADAPQSIARTSSPGRYAREPITSKPRPRRALRIEPNASPISRRRGTSGKVASPWANSASADRQDLGLRSRLRARRVLEAAPLQLVHRGRPPELPGLDEERRREDDAVADDRQEEVVHVVRHGVVASVDERPGAHCPLERERAAHRCSDRDRVELTGGAHEIDYPALEDLVDVDLAHRTLERLDVRQREHGAQPPQRMSVALVAQDLQLVVTVRIAEARL